MDQAQKFALHRSSHPITTLPLELLPIIFWFSLPTLEFNPTGCQCNSFYYHVVTLYKLRFVSKQWEELVDRTSSLWSVVSSTLPDKVNATTLLRSRASPITVHFVTKAGDPTPLPSFHKFLQLVSPHHERWIAASITGPPEILNAPLILSSQALNTLSLTARQDGERDRPMSTLRRRPQVEIPTGWLQDIQHAFLDCVPIRWSEVLPGFKNLKSLKLQSANEPISLPLVLETLAQNPELELVDLANLDGTLPPNMVSPTAVQPIILRHLTDLNLDGTLPAVDGLLRHIQPSYGDIKRLSIAFDTLIIGFDRLAARRFWTETMSPFLPALQDIYSSSTVSRVSVYQSQRCQWSSRSYGGTSALNLFLGGLGAEEALRWISGVVEGGGLQRFPSTYVSLNHGTVKQEEIVRIIKSFPGVTHLDAVIAGSGPSRSDVRWLLEGLADVGSGGEASVGFADLRVMTLRRWRCRLDELLVALQRRFSGRSRAPSIPELCIDLSTIPASWFLNPPGPDPTENIIEFDTVQKIGAIDGVRSLRLGDCEEYQGMLAVIWNEELCIPAWG